MVDFPQSSIFGHFCLTIACVGSLSWTLFVLVGCWTSRDKVIVLTQSDYNDRNFIRDLAQLHVDACPLSWICIGLAMAFG